MSPQIVVADDFTGGTAVAANFAARGARVGSVGLSIPRPRASPTWKRGAMRPRCLSLARTISIARNQGEQ